MKYRIYCTLLPLVVVYRFFYRYCSGGALSTFSKSRTMTLLWSGKAAGKTSILHVRNCLSWRVCEQWIILACYCCFAAEREKWLVMLGNVVFDAVVKRRISPLNGLVGMKTSFVFMAQKYIPLVSHLLQVFPLTRFRGPLFCWKLNWTGCSDDWWIFFGEVMSSH